MPTAITLSSSDPALATYDSPIGSIMLAARGGALVGLWVAGQRFFGSPYGIDEASARSVSAATEGGALIVVTARAPTATNVTADSLRWNICAHFLNE